MTEIQVYKYQKLFPETFLINLQSYGFISIRLYDSICLYYKMMSPSEDPKNIKIKDLASFPVYRLSRMRNIGSVSVKEFRSILFCAGVPIYEANYVGKYRYVFDNTSLRTLLGNSLSFDSNWDGGRSIDNGGRDLMWYSILNTTKNMRSPVKV